MIPAAGLIVALLAVQADGKLVAAGFAQVGDTPDFALARYRAG